MIKEYPEITGAEKMEANLYRILVENPPTNLIKAMRDVKEKGYRVIAMSPVISHVSFLQGLLFAIEREH